VRRCENRLLWQGKVAHVSECGVPMADLLHARLELMHTLSHKVKESPELLSANVEHWGIPGECVNLFVDANSLLWSNCIDQQISWSKQKRERSNAR